MNGMKITVLRDGRIKVETDSFSPALHTTAEAFLNDVHRLLGGERTSESKRGGVHTHEDGTTHSHDEGHQSVGGRY
jgi:hypothetical protein